MHRLPVVAICVMMLAGACASHADGPAALEEMRVDGVLGGSVIAGEGGEGSRLFAVDEVLWDRGPHRNADGVLVIPDSVEPADEIRLRTRSALDPGRRYVVLAARPEPTAADGAWSVVGVLDAATNEMVEAFVPAPRDLLLPGETGPRAELEAVVELLVDATRHRNARELPRPVTRRLARAVQLTELRNGGSGVVGPAAMAIEDYLVIDPSLRRMSPGYELPATLVELLDLEPIHATIVLPAGFADHRWGIGLVSPAGVFGPIPLSPGQRIVEVDAMKLQGSGVTVVGWPSRPRDEVRPLDAGVALGDEEFAARLLDVSIDHEAALTLVIDFAQNTVSSMDRDAAAQLVAAAEDS